MEATPTITKALVCHKDYNLFKKDNLHELPTEPAVFGIFGIVADEPTNCRYIGETDNLQLTVKKIFEEAEFEGLKRFMQGPWIKMVAFESLPGVPADQRMKIADQWRKQHVPKVDSQGEYPGYYGS